MTSNRNVDPADIDALMSDERMHKPYPIQEYITYCGTIRQSIWNNDNPPEKAVTFFENRFVLEMEPIAMICKQLLDEGVLDGTAMVQCLRPGVEDPPDAKVMTTEKTVQIEVTTSIDRYLDKVAIKLSKQGRPVSTTGHTSSDVSGSERSGYTINGYDVEVEAVDKIIAKQKARIAEAIAKKLDKAWSQHGDYNVLCVFVGDNSIPEAECAEFLSMLKNVFAEFRTRLRESNFHRVFMFGNMHSSINFTV